VAGYSVFNKSPSERPYSVREEAEGPKQIETGNLARQGTAEPVEPHADVWRFCSMRGVGSTEPEVSATRITDAIWRSCQHSARNLSGSYSWHVTLDETMKAALAAGQSAQAGSSKNLQPIFMLRAYTIWLLQARGSVP
jgi:hypothetical protein